MSLRYDNLPGDIDDRVEEMALAALDADMYWHMRDEALTAIPDIVITFQGDVDSGWMASAGYLDPLPTVWVRKYPSPITGDAPDLDLELFGFDLPAKVDEKSEPGVPGDFYASWQRKLADLFAPWKTLRNPDALAALADPLIDGLFLISDGTGDGIDTADQGPDLTSRENPAYTASLSALGDASANVSGAAFEAFESRFVDPMPGVMSNLRRSMADYGGLIAGEALAVALARVNVVEFAEKGVTAMSAAHPEAPSTDGLKVALIVAGAVAAGAAIFATGGTAAVVLGVAGVGFGAAADLLPSGGSSRDPAELGGERPDDVFANLDTALESLNASFRSEELSADIKAKALRSLTTDPDLTTLPPAKVQDGQKVIRAMQPFITNMRDELEESANRARRAAASVSFAEWPFHHSADIGAGESGPAVALGEVADAITLGLKRLRLDLEAGSADLLYAWQLHQAADRWTADAIATLETGVKHQSYAG